MGEVNKPYACSENALKRTLTAQAEKNDVKITPDEAKFVGGNPWEGLEMEDHTIEYFSPSSPRKPLCLITKLESNCFILFTA